MREVPAVRERKPEDAVARIERGEVRRAVRGGARVRLDVRVGRAEEASSLPSKVSVRNLNFYYGGQQALFGNSIGIPEKRVTAIIGPSGCGKSTHIRVYNRIYELYRTHRAEGEVLIDGKNILSPSVDLIDLRKRVGMIFQRPTPFPMTISDNIAMLIREGYKRRQAAAAHKNKNA